MATKKRRQELSDNRYETFLGHVELIYLSLTNAVLEFNPTAYDQVRTRKANSLKQAISATYKLERYEKDVFDSTANYRLIVEDEKTALKPVIIECSFLGHFHANSADKDLAEKFTNSVFRLMVWPYFRQFVNDMAGRMSLPPVVVPLLVRD